MSYKPRVTNVEVLRPYVLHLHFDDGFSGTIDLEPMLWGEMFEPLRDPVQFATARPEYGTVCWSIGADFCPDCLREWCEHGVPVARRDELAAADPC